MCVSVLCVRIRMRVVLLLFFFLIIFFSFFVSEEQQSQKVAIRKSKIRMLGRVKCLTSQDGEKNVRLHQCRSRLVGAAGKN